MPKESQLRAIESLEKTIAFIQSLPEWVEVRTVNCNRTGDEIASLQIDGESLNRLFSGKEVYRYAGATMVNGELNGFVLYGTIRKTPAAKSDGNYVMPIWKEALTT